MNMGSMGLRQGACVVLLLGLAACGSESGLEPCDIRNRACQDDVFYAVQRVRGGIWDPWVDRVPMRVITKEERRAELEQAQARREQQRDPNQVDHFGQALELLLLLDPEREQSADIDSSVARVAAYYSEADKAVTVIDPGQVDDLEHATRLLAHELVHAAQDRDFDFSAHRVFHRDESYALGSVIEGEATLYAELLMLEPRGLGFDDIDWLQWQSGWLGGVQDAAYDGASPEHHLSGLVYPLGLKLMFERYRDGGAVAVRRVWDSPPKQSVLFLDDLQAPPPWPCGAPQAPDGYEARGQTRMGAVDLFGLATRLVDSVEMAWDLAKTWRGDRLYLYGNDMQQTIAVWQVRSTGMTADTLSARAADRYGSGTFVVADGQLNIGLSTAGDLGDWDDWQRCNTP